MKATNFLAILIMALVMVSIPAQAQKLKDKREAKKEAWDARQQFIKDSTAIANQQRLDEMRNAQKVAADKAAKEEAERRQREADAREKQRKAEAEAALQEKDYDEPCSDYISTDNTIYGKGSGEDFEQQMSAELARSAALEELASQISTKVQSMVLNYKKSLRSNLKRESVRRIEGMTMTAVDQATGYRIACRKTRTYVQDGERLFKTYMVVEINEDMLLKPLYDGIQKDDELKIDDSYQSFKKDFDEHFQNGAQQALENTINDI